MNVSDSLSSTAPDLAEGSARVPTRVLKQKDFLNLLVAQLKYQDPMSPRQDTEFVAQMAQFSALEQSATTQQDIRGLRTDQQFLQANSLIGRMVDLQAGKDATLRGFVEAVQIEAGTPKIIVDGQPFDLGQVLRVAPVLVEN